MLQMNFLTGFKIFIIKKVLTVLYSLLIFFSNILNFILQVIKFLKCSFFFCRTLLKTFEIEIQH